MDATTLDPIVDALVAAIPFVLAALGAIIVGALGLTLFKWGVPQAIGFFKKIAR